ncbi:hypothetical protein [Bathymodiolus heckerae thiotrophic gill symbiont]|uniref:hypothetical protein n=1 Tax=Bathymodiolus heckerae thiotrophic gill symbiont TaxID=1052212 RepID=UPI002016E3DB|nr:hypothetical protein [Bathymodiolus heckerae thiotrophic gill symbiont]
MVCNPWHYLAVLEKKPGALRHGVPFQAWNLPEPIQQVRKKRLQQDKGDRAFVDCLLLAKDVGIDAFEVACKLTLESGVVTGSIVLNDIRRLTEPDRPKVLSACHDLQLTTEPQASVEHYVLPTMQK